MAVKLDVTKAFDTLSWSFLLKVLKGFGFDTKFIEWIGLILESTKLSILINGSPHGYISYGIGVRHGDPLSPLLFCFAYEDLST